MLLHNRVVWRRLAVMHLLTFATKRVRAVCAVQICIITNGDRLSTHSDLWIRLRFSRQMAVTLGSQSVIVKLSVS